MSTRLEKDSMGSVAVAALDLWGAQTQRALEHFKISTERMPLEMIVALAQIKCAAAKVNRELGLLDERVARAIEAAAEEIVGGDLIGQFPLPVWQTGSGTQTNMNVNEVIANRASELMGGPRGEGRLVHPNDHVNLGQSSNDVFPTAMNVAAARAVIRQLLPTVENLRLAFQAKSDEYKDLVKIGRTHLQDATPLTLGQELSGHVAQLAQAEKAITAALVPVYELAIGGTAVGTGLNTHPEFGTRVAAKLAHLLDIPLSSAPNKFAALASHDTLANLHGTFKVLAIALMKIANDVRWLASGPRCGIGELSLPENEPGSSIMPGKVNPTQCEALTMLCCQVMGNDVALSTGAAMGQFELNTFKPLIAYNLLQSIRLLTDGMRSFEMHCVVGMQANRDRINDLLHHSLMLVTALAPHIGYDRAAKIAQKAHAEGSSLRAAALASGVSTSDFDRWVQVDKMV